MLILYRLKTKWMKQKWKLVSGEKEEKTNKVLNYSPGLVQIGYRVTGPASSSVIRTFTSYVINQI